jgi:hypothetical protein
MTARAIRAAVDMPEMVVRYVTFSSCRLAGEPLGRPLWTDEG